MSTSYAVGIVLMPDFGDSLFELAGRMPVWIVDTPINRAAAKRYWAERPGASHAHEVTTFKVDVTLAAETWLVGVIATVDLHHGEMSQDPPYEVVEVFGAALAPVIREAFAEHGFTQYLERPGGFVARHTS